jgi:hypothetical protein
VASDFTEICFTSSPWTVMSPWKTRILSVPGLPGSEKAIWLVASSARAGRRGRSAAAARRRAGRRRVVFMMFLF